MKLTIIAKIRETSTCFCSPRAASVSGHKFAEPGGGRSANLCFYDRHTNKIGLKIGLKRRICVKSTYNFISLYFQFLGMLQVSSVMIVTWHKNQETPHRLVQPTRSKGFQCLPGGTVGYPAPPRIICLSVSQSVCPSVSPSVCPSVHRYVLIILQKIKLAQQFW